MLAFLLSGAPLSVSQDAARAVNLLYCRSPSHDNVLAMCILGVYFWLLSVFDGRLLFLVDSVSLFLDFPQVYFKKALGRHIVQRDICLQDPSEVRWGNRLVGFERS